MDSVIENILLEDERRCAALFSSFDPVSGRGSFLSRERVVLEDFVVPEQWLPLSMCRLPLVVALSAAGGIERYVVDVLGHEDVFARQEMVRYIEMLLLRTRYAHDFAFWCAALARIENKEGGGGVPFVLNSPQRKAALLFENQRLASRPLRVVILKARQWGGSTLTQIYMAWLQLMQRKGINSLIIAHVKDTANNIKQMFHRLMNDYPLELLQDIDDEYPLTSRDSAFTAVYGSRNVHAIPLRECRVQIGSAEYPDSCRGENHTLLHCSEVAMWKRTEGKKPEDIVRSASAGILYKPLTMIVYESTAQRREDFFHGEWQAAVDGRSQFAPLFVGWHEIEQYRLSLTDKAAFAGQLWSARGSGSVESDRADSGSYLWWLWEQGATLEGINWYIEERKKFKAHDEMAREYPTDADEAFTHTAQCVFSTRVINNVRGGCCPASFVGEVVGRGVTGDQCLLGVRFVADASGGLLVWSMPVADSGDTLFVDRYLVVVDVGRGVSSQADFSDIVVFDRAPLLDGGFPTVVAEWHGHIDIDLLAWKGAQVAKWYNEALLVIESNTIESNGGVGANMGDSSAYVLELIGDVYPNMYYREQSEEDIIKKLPKKIGFHTNRKTKRKVIQELGRALREGSYVERNEAVLAEYASYEVLANGGFGAPHGKHDDRLMTRAIGLYVSNLKMEMPRVVERVRRVGYGGLEVATEAMI